MYKVALSLESGATTVYTSSVFPRSVFMVICAFGTNNFSKLTFSFIF